MIVQVEGTGPAPVLGLNATTDYTLWLSNGTMVETTKGDPDGPFSFPLGSGMVVSGAIAAAAPVRVAQALLHNAAWSRQLVALPGASCPAFLACKTTVCRYPGLARLPGTCCS